MAASGAETNTNYTLDELKIHSLMGGEIDLAPHFINIEIYEDIHATFLTAQIDIYEVDSFVEILPIVGDEYVTCKYTVHGMHKGAKKKFEFELDVYKVEQEKMGTHKQTMFRLRLISRSFKKNASKRNRKFYVGTQDAIVEEICMLQLQKPVVRMDACEFEEEYIFPNWHPIGCINQMVTNAKSVEYGDPDYVFYEDMEGFHFVSMSYMIDPAFDQVFPTFGMRFRSIIPVEYNEGNNMADYNVSDYHKKSSFDVITDTNVGMFGMTLIHHDIHNRKWREEGDNYLSTFGNFMHNGLMPLTLFAGPDNEKNRIAYVPMNGIENPGVYQDEFYVEQRRNLIIRQMQTEHNTMILEIDGEPEMRVGRPLDFKLFSIKGNDKNALTENDKLTGFFLINKIRHFLDREYYKQFVEISKDTYFK